MRKLLVGKAEILRGADEPDPDVLRNAIANCVTGRDWRASFGPIWRLHREGGYRVEKIFSAILGVLLQGLPGVDENTLAGLLQELAEAHEKSHFTLKIYFNC